MLRKLIQAIGHRLGAPFGYDMCILSRRNERGDFQWQFKWAKIEIERKTQYRLSWSFSQDQESRTQFTQTHTSYESARAVAEALIIRKGCLIVEIWQEDIVDRLVSRRTKV